MKRYIKASKVSGQASDAVVPNEICERLEEKNPTWDVECHTYFGSDGNLHYEFDINVNGQWVWGKSYSEFDFYGENTEGEIAAGMRKISRGVNRALKAL